MVKQSEIYFLNMWIYHIDFTVLNLLTQDISDAITSSKLKYYEGPANKLNDPKTAPKMYFKILKT